MSKVEEFVETFKVTKDLEGLRLDQALAHFVESRTQALQIIQAGQVQIKNVPHPKPSYRVEFGDQISYTKIQKKMETNLEPYDFPIHIIHEDASILVIEKPAGLVSHPSVGHPNDSVVNALIHKLNLDVGYSTERPGLLHRLDKDVSGLLVLSKTHQAQNFLAKQFLTKQIKRKYWGLCYSPVLFEEGRIETFIKRHPKDRKKFIVSSTDGKKSITLFKVLRKGEISLVEFQLLTGRTHQVRIHSQEVTGGIVGDPVYTSSKRVRDLKDTDLTAIVQSLDRIALHAVELTFIHPETKKECTFQSVFPTELQAILDRLESKR